VSDADCHLTAEKVDTLEGRLAETERKLELLERRADDAELSQVAAINEFKRAAARVNEQVIEAATWRSVVSEHMKNDEKVIGVISATLARIDAKLEALIAAKVTA